MARTVKRVLAHRSSRQVALGHKVTQTSGPEQGTPTRTRGLRKSATSCQGPGCLGHQGDVPSVISGHQRDLCRCQETSAEPLQASRRGSLALTQGPGTWKGGQGERLESAAGAAQDAEPH